MKVWDSEPRQTTKMEIFAVIVYNLLSLTIFKKSSIMGVRLGSEYASVDIKQLLTFSKKNKKNEAVDLLAN